MEYAIIIKRGTPLTFEHEQKGRVIRDRGTFRSVLRCLANQKFVMTIPGSFRLFVRGQLIDNEYSWLDMFKEMEAGRAKRVSVAASLSGSYRAKEVRDG